MDGVLVVDYPPEECAEFAQDLRAHGLDPIFLLAPTSTEARIAAVAEHAAGYVYYVSLKGVTGAGPSRHRRASRRACRAIRACTAGAGRRRLRHPRCGRRAQAVARVADAVVIGSRLIQEIGERSQERGVRAACAGSDGIRCAGLDPANARDLSANRGDAA